MSAKTTLRDIAKACGVSPATVSLALRNHPRISKATTHKIQETADKMGYQRDARISELMTHLQQNAADRSPETLAWITVCDKPTTLTNAYLVGLFEGMKAQAERLGYRVDSFNISEKQGMPAEKVEKILLSRGIRGVVFAPMLEGNLTLPLCIDAFANITASFKNHGIPISTALPNHCQNMRICLRHIRDLGYTRPGFYLHPDLDEREDHRWRGAFLADTGKGSPFACGKVLRDYVNGKDLAAWIRKHNVDVLLTTERDSLPWLREQGYSFPEDLGFAALTANPGWYPEPVSGINEHPEVLGTFAVDLLQGQLHRNNKGPTAFPKEVLYDGAWTGNFTVRRVGQAEVNC
ncbi:MAG: LacI family DNA-binding transcriptional regulator [Kiritimatiellia bacterium]